MTHHEGGALVTFAEVLERSRRHNQEEEYRVYPIVSRVGKVLTWILVNLGVSANQTTVLFALVAIASAVLFAVGGTAATVVALVLYWLHFILDFSDGDIARFNQRFARNGEYWDHAIHLFTVPLILAGVVLSEVRQGAPTLVVAAGLLITVVGAFNVGLTDVARLATAPESTNGGEAPDGWITDGAKPLFRIAARVVGVSPFLTFYAATVVLVDDPRWRETVIVVFAVALTLSSLLKVVVTHRTGYVPRRFDLGE